MSKIALDVDSNRAFFIGTKMDRAKLDEIIAITSTVLEQSSFECVEAEWVAQERVLRLFVDHDEGEATMTIEHCVEATKTLRNIDQLDEMVDGKYNLEVSSPGVERPLRKPDHFKSRIGEQVKVSLIKKSSDRREGSGAIVSVETAGVDTEVTLETTNGSWSFDLRNLKRATLVFDWDSKKQKKK